MYVIIAVNTVKWKSKRYNSYRELAFGGS